MGHAFAADLADGTLPLEAAIALHLRANHYPPVPSSMVSPCIAAIDAILAGDDERLIPLPHPVTYRDRSEAPAYAIAEAHHLDAFLT